MTGIESARSERVIADLMDQQTKLVIARVAVDCATKMDESGADAVGCAIEGGVVVAVEQETPPSFGREMLS